MRARSRYVSRYQVEEVVGHPRTCLRESICLRPEARLAILDRGNSARHAPTSSIAGRTRRRWSGPRSRRHQVAVHPCPGGGSLLGDPLLRAPHRLGVLSALMPWIVKGLLILAKTRRGRKLLFAVGLTAIDLAQSDRARRLYAKARTSVNDPAVRQTVTRRARKIAQAIRR